jgi:outer membrane biosynthesis protein TonB
MMQKDIYKIRKKTIYKVILFHILLIGIISIDFNFSNTKVKKFAVKTIIVKPEIKPQKASGEKSGQKIAAKKQAPIKNQIANQEKKIIKKEVKKTASLIPNKLLNDLEKSLSKLDKNEKKEVKKEVKKEDLYIPKEIKKANFDIKPTENKNLEFNFSNVLIQELKENLILPEYGEVKVSFTISSIGKIENIEIIEYKSEKNKSYLKNNLAKLQLKCLSKLDNMKQNYIVVFKND